jgi:hypothetical protein
MLMFGQSARGAALSAPVGAAACAVPRPLPPDLSRPRPKRATPCVGPLPNEECIGWEAAAYLALEAQERARG